MGNKRRTFSMRTLLKLDSVRFSRRGEASFSFLSNSMQAREYVT
jgi:hypothetical protein